VVSTLSVRGPVNHRRGLDAGKGGRQLSWTEDAESPEGGRCRHAAVRTLDRELGGRGSGGPVFEQKRW
jgi:hypothetical protein